MDDGQSYSGLSDGAAHFMGAICLVRLNDGKMAMPSK